MVLQKDEIIYKLYLKKCIIILSKGNYLCRLAHLHDEVKPKILHGSIKASNILMHHKWNPKIFDFYLVKVLSLKRSHVLLKVEAFGSVFFPSQNYKII